jgi:ABC-type antimicrobial peptide transport system permease subunit
VARISRRRESRRPRLLIGGTNPHPAEIVGIVGNVHQNVENTGCPGSVYVPFAQSGLASAMLAIRTQANPAQYAATVRDAVQTIDKDQPVSEIRTMDQLMEAQLGQRRLLRALLASFAGTALVLALIGIYGILSYSVAQRTHEMGIRRALGAREHDIISLILGQGLRLALAGILFGLLGAFGLTRVMNSVLFQVSAGDPATYAVWPACSSWRRLRQAISRRIAPSSRSPLPSCETNSDYARVCFAVSLFSWQNGFTALQQVVATTGVTFSSKFPSARA